MATAIRGFFFDDEELNIQAFIDRIEPKFERSGWKVEWTRQTDHRKARQELAGAVPYDLVIVDLLVARKDQTPGRPDDFGLDVVQAARDHSERTYILAISMGDDNGPQLFYQARDRGATRAISRNQITNQSAEYSPAALVEHIQQHLLNNGSISDLEVRAEDERDPHVQAVLHEVGAETVAQLYRGMLGNDRPELRSVHVGFVTPGASGAHVCTVTAATGVGQLRHVIKVSRNPVALTDEVRRNKLACALLPPQLVVRQQPDQPVGPVNGWFAVGGQLVRQAATLRQWLAAGRSPRVVHTVLHTLFTQGMCLLYAENQRPAAVDPLSLLVFPFHRQSLVLNALDELGGAIGRPEGCGIGGAAQRKLVTDLTGFVENGMLPGVTRLSVPRTTYTTCMHGDLHCGNVIVDAGPNPHPMVVDFASFGHGQHWAVDPARLLVDLVMRSVDAGAESMFFTGFPVWRRLVARAAAGESSLTGVGAHRPNSTALAALGWVAANVRQICPAVATDAGWQQRRWEWHAVLAMFLLRASFHRDLPPPKRALALVAGHDQLLVAATRLPGK